MVVLAVAARGLICGVGLVPLDDPDGYLDLARSLARGEGFRINGRPTAYRPPLYPILLAPLAWACDGPRLAAGLAAFHLALGGLTVALVADLARRWGLRRWACGVAAAIVAFDPVLVVQAKAPMTETLAASLVAATLWGLTLPGWRGAVGGGLGFGLAALCRPSLLPAAFVTAGLGLRARPGDRARRVGRSALLLATTGAVVAPWAARNARALGEPVWATTHGGYTLALANNPSYYADVLDGPPDAVWSGPRQRAWVDSINAATAGLSEMDADRRLRRQAIDLARARPGAFARATGARLARFWGVMPSAAVYPPPLRWATAAWTVPLWLALIAGLATRTAWCWPRLAAGASMLALGAIHAAYWTDLRMRAPLVPAIAPVAAAGLARLRSGYDRGREPAPDRGGDPPR